MAQACRPVGMGPHSPALLSSWLRVWQNGRARPAKLNRLMRLAHKSQPLSDYAAYSADISLCTFMVMYSRNT